MIYYTLKFRRSTVLEEPSPTFIAETLVKLFFLFAINGFNGSIVLHYEAKFFYGTSLKKEWRNHLPIRSLDLVSLSPSLPSPILHPSCSETAKGPALEPCSPEARSARCPLSGISVVFCRELGCHALCLPPQRVGCARKAAAFLASHPLCHLSIDLSMQSVGICS